MADNISPVAAIESTSIISTLNIDKPEEMAKLFTIFGNDGADTYDLIRALGWSTPVAQEDYQHTEKERIVDTFHDLNGSAAGATKTITLEPNDLDSNNNFYPRQGDIVRFNNGITGVIQSIDVTTPAAPILTVKTLTATNLPLTVAGEEITITSRVQGEGSQLTTGAFTKTRKRSFRLQIIPERFVVTGSEMTNQKWITQFEGVSGNMFYLLGQHDAETRSRVYTSGAWLYGEQNTVNVTDPQSLVTAPYRTMNGLLPAITADGINQTYPAGLLSVPDFKAIGRKLNKEGVMGDVLVWAGFDFLSQTNDVLLDYSKNQNINTTNKYFTDTYFRGNDALSQAVNFKSIVLDGYNYMFIQNSMFSHPKFGGATGYKDSGTAVFIPMKKQRTQEGDVPSVGMRYKELGGINRMAQIWMDGAAGANPAQFIGQYDINSLTIRMHVGSQFVALNQMAKLTIA